MKEGEEDAPPLPELTPYLWYSAHPNAKGVVVVVAAAAVAAVAAATRRDSWCALFAPDFHLSLFLQKRPNAAKAKETRNQWSEQKGINVSELTHLETIRLAEGD